MLRLLFGSAKLKSVVAKWIMRTLRKNGLDMGINFSDFTVYSEDDKIMVHFSGDVKVNEAELMNFLDKKLDG